MTVCMPTHPVLLVVISGNDLSASTAFYSKVFAWQPHPISNEIVALVAAGGPSISLRSNVPEGFPGVVPFISVPDVDAALKRVVEAGGSIERPPWTIPMAGTLARFKDPSGTIYGLASGAPPGDLPRVPPPFASNPRPPANTVCSLEMYAADQTAAGRFFGDLFGWSTQSTIPQYLAFDPGAGIGGVFQSHTPALPAVAYVYVADVAAKLNEIEAAGGKRTADAMPVPGMATFGYFKDPSGTDMGLMGA